MAVFRAFLLFLALLGFFLVGAPIQALALSRGWRLAEKVPVLFHRTICAIMRVRVMVGGHMAQDLPLLIVSNHVSWVDIMTLSTQKPVCFLAKREMKSWPIFGTFAVLQNSVFVDRAKLSDLPKVNGQIAERLKAQKRVVVFAESTTTDGNTMLPFRPSHFGAAQVLLESEPEVPSVAVQPVAVSYVSHGGRAEIPWYGDMLLAPHIWRLLRSGPFTCTIRFGDCLAFTRAMSRKAMAQATEQAVRSLLRRDEAA